MSWNLPYRYAQRSAGETRDYVYFAALDPVKGELRRKRIYLDHISNKKTRDRHAVRLIDHINKKLDAGQNPFVDDTSKKQYTTSFNPYSVGSGSVSALRRTWAVNSEVSILILLEVGL